MPFILIKNHLKLMFRSVWVFVLMILGPIFVIGIISNVFEAFMESYQGKAEFVIGYRMEDTHLLYSNLDGIKAELLAQGITLVEYPKGDISSILLENNCKVFVDFNVGEYTIYKMDGGETEGAFTEYFLGKMFRSPLNNSVSGGEVRAPVYSTAQLPAVDHINSTDYYGIVYIVYFIWCGFICLTSVVTSERKSRIGEKYAVSPVSAAGLYLGKLVPLALMMLSGIGISVCLVTSVFHIHWGNYPMTILLLFLTILAASSFGLFLCLLFKNMAVVVVIGFTLIWIAGFIGGSFETYMFSNVAETIKCLSPIYHVNRSLVEYSVMGSSQYTQSSIYYLIGMIAACGILGVFTIKIKRGRSL